MTRPRRRIIVDGVERELPAAVPRLPRVIPPDVTPADQDATLVDLMAAFRSGVPDVYIFAEDGRLVKIGELDTVDVSSDRINITSFNDDEPRYVQGLTHVRLEVRCTVTTRGV